MANHSVIININKGVEYEIDSLGNDHFVFFSSDTLLGFETYVAPSGFDRSAQPFDIYEMFQTYWITNNTAKYIYSVPDTFTNYSRLSANENPIHSDGTSYSYGYELAGTKYIKDVLLTTAVGSYPDGYYDTITVLSTASYPDSGKISLGEGYAVCVYNNTPASGFFTYTSKDDTHFYGISQRVQSFGTIVSPVINWSGTTKRWVIVNNTNMDMQGMYLGNYIKCDWIYAGDKINHIQCGSGSIGSSTVKWIHIHKLNNITTYGYCDFYQSNLYGELKLSTNPACTSIGGYTTDYDYGSSFVGNRNITGTLTIPSNITNISSSSFSQTGINSIIFNEGLVTLRVRAFFDCRNLANIGTLPSTLTSIGDFAFYLCNSYGNTPINLTIPSIVTIGYCAFGRSKFTNIVSNNPNYVMYDKVLYDITGGNCKAIYSEYDSTGTITFRTGTTEIQEACFYNSLRTGILTIINSITNIKGDAFVDALQLTGSLDIPNTVTSIGINSFYNTRFTSLTIGTGITSIPNAAFQNMISVTGNIIIPDNVTSIGYASFNNMQLATGTLSLSNNLISIDNFAFAGAGFTGTLNINSSITTIKERAFELNHFNEITSTNTNYQVSDNVLYDVKTSGKVKATACANLYVGPLTLRSDTTEILIRTFYNCSRTGTLTLPNTITNIRYGSFSLAVGFTGNLTLPNNSNLALEEFCFEGCNGLTGDIVITNPSIAMSITYANLSLQSITNATGLVLPTGYTSATDFTVVSNNFSAITLNQSLLNITDGTVGTPKTFKIGSTNKARLLSSYPTAETDANARYILIT